MRRPVGIVLTTVVCCSLASCGVNIIAHDQSAAAVSAEKFAEAAYIQGNYPAAYGSLSQDMQRAIPIEKLVDAITKMHPNSRPTEVNAIEFEPLQGQRAMNIYLKGSRYEEDFFYRLLMVGEKGTSYKVGGLWRGNGPPPPSARKPL